MVIRLHGCSEHHGGPHWRYWHLGILIQLTLWFMALRLCSPSPSPICPFYAQIILALLLRWKATGLDLRYWPLELSGFAYSLVQASQ